MADGKSVSYLIKGLKHGQTVDAKDRFGIDQRELSLQWGCLLCMRMVFESRFQLHLGDEFWRSVIPPTSALQGQSLFARGYCWWLSVDSGHKSLRSVNWSFVIKYCSTVNVKPKTAHYIGINSRQIHRMFNKVGVWYR